MRLLFRVSVVISLVLFFSLELLAEKNIVCRSNFSKIRGMRSLAGYKTEVKTLSNRIKVFSLSATEQSAAVLSKKLAKKNDKVLGLSLNCSEDVEVKVSRTPNDTNYGIQANLGVIKSPESWDLTTGSQSVKVAVIDTGIFYTHPDLSANMLVNSSEIASNGIDDDGNGVIDDIYGANFVSNNGNPLDDHGHGSHCAGIIGATGDNSTGIAGVNYSVSLLAVKGLNASGSGSMSSIAAGVDYARRMGVHVMNLSLGSTSDSSVLKNALQQASDAGIVLVFAAGNESTNNDSTPSYPAAYNFTNSITVAATNNSDVLTDFSNYGATTTHLAAPGYEIPATYINNQYVYMSGTSMAAPHVAGVAALVKAYDSSKTGTQIKSCILSNVDTVSGLSGKVSTGGRLNAYRALVCDGSTYVPSPTPTPTPGSGGGGGAQPEPTVPSVAIDYSIKASKDGSKGIKVVAKGETSYQGELVSEIPVGGECEVTVKGSKKALKKYSISVDSDEYGEFSSTKSIRLSSSVMRSGKTLSVSCFAYDASDENSEMYQETTKVSLVTRKARR